MSTSRTLALWLTLAASLAANAFAGGPGTLKFDQSSLAVGEGAGTVTVWVERSQGEDGAVSVVVSSTGGSATPGADFAPVSQMLSWGPNDGTSKAVQVAIVNDTASESVETIQLTLAGATGGATIDPTRASFTLTLVDDDGGSPPPPPPPPGCEPGDDSCNGGGAAGTFKFDERSFFAYESGGVAVVSVERSQGESGAASVSYSTGNGTASAGADYTATSGTLSWAAGDGSTKTFTVPILEDDLAEGPETIQLTLSGATGGATIDGERGTAVLTLLDDGDVPPPGCEPGDDSCNGGGGGAAGVLKFGEASFQVIEGQAVATIRVERSQGEAGTVSVAYAATAGSASAGADFQPVSGILTWGAGDGTDRTFTVPILADSAAEGTETVNLALTAPTGGASVDTARGSALLSILDDDGSTQACQPGDDRLCLLGGRFSAAISFRTPNFGSGVGQGRSVSLSDKSGYFWFFDAGNAEMLLKVIDGCGIAGGPAYWVFYAATTNVDFTLTVTDTRTGVSKQFFNPLGKTAEPVQDVATFTTCP